MIAMTPVLTHTTIGRALLETLDEIAERQAIPEDVVKFITTMYEKTLWEALSKRSKLKISIQGSKLVGSRHIEGQWTLIKKDVTIKMGYRKPFTVEKLKIIAIPRLASVDRDSKPGLYYQEDMVKKEEPIDLSIDINFF